MAILTDITDLNRAVTVADFFSSLLVSGDWRGCGGLAGRALRKANHTKGQARSEGGEGEKKRMARPTFQVTEQQSEQVKTMASLGLRQDDIAKVLNIAAKTLRKHFRKELDTGAIEANTEVAKTCYRMATSGTNTTATIFWLKARAGWRENAPIEEKKEPKTPDTPGLPLFAVTETGQHKREPLA